MTSEMERYDLIDNKYNINLIFEEASFDEFYGCDMNINGYINKITDFIDRLKLLERELTFGNAFEDFDSFILDSFQMLNYLDLKAMTKDMVSKYTKDDTNKDIKTKLFIERYDNDSEVQKYIKLKGLK